MLTDASGVGAITCESASDQDIGRRIREICMAYRTRLVACLALLLGCLIGNAMLAVAGMIGADARVPGMALMRAPLGQRLAAAGPAAGQGAPSPDHRG